MNKPKIRIDVVSDVVCPWCYIGKRRLEKAVDHLKADYDFEIHYHPFELNPDVPEEGFDQKAYLIKKFGSEARYNEIVSNVTEVADSEGLKFDFGRQSKSPNTRDAHRIIWLAEQEGKQLSVVESLFKAYFEEGIDLTNKGNLIQIAVKAGLEGGKVKELLATDLGLKEVRVEEMYNQKIGITGVPFYIINNKYTVSGAQSTDLFIEALPDIALKSSLEGESCEAGGNCN